MNARKARHVVLSLVALVFSSSCLDVSGTGVADSQIRIVNAANQTLTLFLDGQLSIDDSHQVNVSLIVVQSGEHTLVARTAGGVDATLPFVTTPGGQHSVYAYTNDAGVVNLVLLDSAAVPTGSNTKIRALNLSKLAGAIDIYAVPPSGTGAQLNPSFGYLTATPYTQGAAGSWEVYFTASGSVAKTRSTGLFPVLPGERRTVVVLDSASIPVFRVLPN